MKTQLVLFSQEDLNIQSYLLHAMVAEGTENLTEKGHASQPQAQGSRWYTAECWRSSEHTLKYDK